MLAPFTLIVFILYKEKVGKIVFGVITLIMLFNLIGCNSRAGIAGAAVSSLVVLFMLRKKIIKNWKICLVVILSLAILTFGVDRILHGKITKYMSGVIFRNTTVVKNEFSSEDTIPLKDIKIDGDKAQVVTSTETLKFQYTDGKLSLYDANDKPLADNYKSDTGQIIIQDARYKDYSNVFGKDNNSVTIFQVNKGPIKLTFKLDKEIKLITNTGREITFGPVAKWGFNGQEKLASSRGYIWSRSIPLIKDTIILGHGADTFTMYFPQSDFKGKMVAYSGDMTQVVDKPHNLYLQNAINNGCVALIALLTLFIGYIVISIKTLLKSEFNDFKSIVSLGILAAIIAYMGAAVFNDSVISVAPVFWVLLGIGISLNISIKEAKNNKEAKNIRGSKGSKSKKR